VRITRTVGLTETTVDRLSDRITETIAALEAEGLTVVDIGYAPLAGLSGGGESWDCYTALLLIGEAS
jgi:hypothetical protein